MKFNLEDYETVEERIRKFYEVYPDGRIVTKDVTKRADREKGIWEIQAFLYLNPEEQSMMNPKSTGFAFEVDGKGMANQTSALENCETSAIGRALANAGFSGNKRASREEMEKVVRNKPAPHGLGGIMKPATSSWEEKIAAVKTKDQARDLWIAANRAGVSKEILAQIQKLADEL